MTIYLDLGCAQLRDMREKNRFAFDNALKIFADGRRYLVGDTWVDIDAQGKNRPKLNGKPQKTEIRFNDESSLRAMKDVFCLWQFFEAKGTVNPVLPDECFNRLAAARKTGETVNFFVPWGIRPDFCESLYCKAGCLRGTAENAVLDELRLVQEAVQAKGVSMQLTIMPADAYATEVNNITDTNILSYFDAVDRTVCKKWGDDVCKVLPWTTIRQKNAARYGQLLCETTPDKIRKVIPGGMIDNAFKSARRFNPNKSAQEQEQAAFRYLRERLVESILIEETMKPIKLSLVDPAKDSRVDGPLPRLYIIPEQIRFPWLKPAFGG